MKQHIVVTAGLWLCLLAPLQAQIKVDANNKVGIGGNSDANSALRVQGNTILDGTLKILSFGSSPTSLLAKNSTGVVSNVGLGSDFSIDVAGNLVYNGTGGSGITSLNGLSNSTQIFAVSNTSGAFAFTPSTPPGTNGVHTLNIPSASSSTTGLLSSTDWSIFNSKGNLSGTGTANYLPLWTAGSTQGNSIVTQNSAGTNVGVSETTPTQKLHVNGNLRLTGIIYDSNNSPGTDGQVLKNSNGSLVWGIDNGGSGGGLTNLNGLTANTQTFAFGAAGLAPGVSSNNTTNVHMFNFPLASGAGVTSGTISKTDYDNFAGKQPLLVSGTNIKTINGVSILGSGDLSINTTDPNAWKLDGNTVGAAKRLGTIDNFGLIFKTNNVDRMTLSNSGEALFFGRIVQEFPSTKYNTSIGYEAGNLSASGNYNNFVGYQAGKSTTTGSSNNIIGESAGTAVTTGSNNQFFGKNAGLIATTGSNNVFIGQNAGSAETGSNKLIIHSSDAATSTPLISGDFTQAALTVNGSLKVTSYAGTGAVGLLGRTSTGQVAAVSLGSTLTLNSTTNTLNATVSIPYAQISTTSTSTSAPNTNTFYPITLGDGVSTGGLSAVNDQIRIGSDGGGTYKVEYSATGNAVGSQVITYDVSVNGNQSGSIEAKESIYDYSSGVNYNMSRSFIRTFEANDIIRLTFSRSAGTSATNEKASLIVTKL